ncbi:uncharacterized protein [Rutidosis leptorrhynchoides]|uniref:uncharacterized protein n=1 Tax=Rutidosis leptorrhynchoides TaxID=125765 RepID=UPI003A9A53C5
MNKEVPRKVNIFLWRVAWNRLSTRRNLSAKGLEISDIGCVICDCHVESLDHILFGCALAMDHCRRTRIWLDINMPSYNSWQEWLSWVDSSSLTSITKIRISVIIASLVWHIWRFCNNSLFGLRSMKKETPFYSIR